MIKIKPGLIILLILLVYSCTKNHYISDHAVRPKRPKFSILKKPFIGNSLIDTSHLYISTHRPLNYDGRKVIWYIGFYNHGKMITGTSWESEMSSTLATRNSWQTAACIGYYTTGDNKIRMQYFMASDGGTYMPQEGVIRKHTIILENPTHVVFKKVMEYDTLIKSRFRIATK